MWPFKYPYSNFHELNLDWLLSIVKSNESRISANELKIKLIGGDDPLNSLHPVGSIYISTENTSPASLFGGEWAQINGRFLIGTGEPELNDDGTSPGSYNFAADSKGGEEKHTLTLNEMPNHYHDAYLLGLGGTAEAPAYFAAFNQSAYNYNYANPTPNTTIIATAARKGDDAAHNNMPPYLAVYMWKRVK